MDRVLVITDSRGRDIHNFLSKELYVTTKVLPGAKIQEIASVAKAEHVGKPFKLTVIAGGICNLTHRETSKSIKCLRYDTDEETRRTKLEQIKNTVLELQDSIKPVIFCTITPASIVKYYKHHNAGKIHQKQAPETPTTEYQEEQTALQTDVKIINDFLIENSINGNTKTVNWHKFSIRNSVTKNRRGRKKRIAKFVDTNITDGVHFNKYLKQKCFEETLKVIKKRIVEEPQNEEETDSELNTSQESISTWDFKRENKNEKK